MKRNQHLHRLGQTSLLLLLFSGLVLVVILNPLAPSEPILAAATPQGELAVVTTISTPAASPTAAPTPWPSFTLTSSPTPTFLPPTTRPTNTPLATATFSPSPTGTPTQTPRPTPTIPPTQRLLLVDQDQQMMFVYEHEIEVRSIPVSSGAPVTDQFTPAWTGQVGADWGSGSIGRNGFYTDYMWYLFDGPEGSILIHSVPYKKDGTDKVYDRLEALGVTPTSNGCVRISPEDAAWLRVWNPVDVPIKITRWSGGINPAENLFVPEQGE